MSLSRVSFDDKVDIKPKPTPTLSRVSSLDNTSFQPNPKPTPTLSRVSSDSSNTSFDTPTLDDTKSEEINDDKESLSINPGTPNMLKALLMFTNVNKLNGTFSNEIAKTINNSLSAAPPPANPSAAPPPANPSA